MTKSKTPTTIPYFQFDTGTFLKDTRGFSAQHIGYYTLLMAIYWESKNTLPPLVDIKRSLFVRSKKDEEILQQVISHFFPFGENEYLDTCREYVLDTSRRQSAIARRRWDAEKVRKAGVTTDAPDEDESGNF